MDISNILSQSQKDFYDKNGYLVIKKLLTDSEISKYYNRFDELVENPKERTPLLMVMRDVSLKNLAKKDRKSEQVVTKLQYWPYDKVLWTYAQHKNIIKYIEAIIGEDIRAHHFMSINKPPDPGPLSSRHPLHQDQWYFPFIPSKHIVCSWTALQYVNRQNGCLVVIPGTHKTKLLPHAYPKQWSGAVNKAYHGIQYKGDISQLLSQRVHLEMDPGDTVFFHPLLIHGSGANLTNANRRSISVHYCNSKLCDFVPGGVIPEQKTISTEAEQLAKRITGFSTNYDKIWKMKSRQVKGDVGNFKV
eukprot:258639_1